MTLDYLPNIAHHDVGLIQQFSGPRLRRLAHIAVGLSAESMDLLIMVSGKLRAAEGALPDPADYAPDAVP